VSDPTLIVEGAWLLATNDGDAGHEEVMALALIMDQLSESHRQGIEADKAFADNEEEWFDELARAHAGNHDPLLDVLFLVCATDREVQVSERRFLRRVGKAIGRDIDFERLESICRHLAHGEDLPPGTFRGL
jgi:DnaJ-domain-containing protein 1